MLSDTAEIVGELPQPPVILPAERGQLHILVAQLPLPRGGVFRGRVFRRRDGDGTALPADALEHAEQRVHVRSCWLFWDG
jgi:hypothetical protein